MLHIPKQSYYARCPGLEQMRNCLCGPVTKSLETPVIDKCDSKRCVKEFLMPFRYFRWLCYWTWNTFVYFFLQKKNKGRTWATKSLSKRCMFSFFWWS